jgi:hypothetical protein
MPTTSVTAAVITKYESLTAANFPGSSRPRIDFGSAAQVVSGLQLRPPFVVLKDNGREVKILDFERNNLQIVRFVFEVYAASAGDVDTIVSAIRLNGGGVGAGSGFDYGTLSDLTSPRSTHQIIPTAEPRLLSSYLDKDGVRIHGATLQYQVTVLEVS